jgi:hypothetical protein
MTTKQQLGAFYTTEVHSVLKGFEYLVQGKHITDMYCGDNALLDWATHNNALSTTGYDINPTCTGITQDTLMEPVSNIPFALINPPFLGKNKSQNKGPYIKWGVDDLYKASLLSMIGNVEEAIVIIPSNFLMDRDTKTRTKFFNAFEVRQCVLFDKRMFEDTNVRVMAFHCIKGKTTHINGQELHDTKIGKEYFELLSTSNTEGISRLTEQNKDSIDKKGISSISLITTDSGGTRMLGLSKEIEPYIGKHSDRNRATIVFDTPLSLVQQEIVITETNKLITDFRTKYDSMFLTNFLAGKDGVMRKRIGFTEVYKLINHVIKEHIKC